MQNSKLKKNKINIFCTNLKDDILNITIFGLQLRMKFTNQILLNKIY